MANISDLKLAPVSLGDDRNVSSAYGAESITAKYCGIRRLRPPIAGVWTHGWIPPYLMIDPATVINQYNPPKVEERYFVATELQREFLMQHGFADVHAIGLPIVYVSRAPVWREPGSLLVMPPHSLSYTYHDWDEEGYASAIDSVRKEFSRVVVCIHPSCWSRGYWIGTFQRRGYEIIKGIGAQPQKPALEWLADVLRSFEFVTTNGFGSHIPYAAYFGCKVSIFGPWAGYRLEDFRDAPAYAVNRLRYEELLQRTTRHEIARQYPFLVREPMRAIQTQEWSKQEVGEKHKRLPAELRALFGWTRKNRRQFAVAEARRSARRIVGYCLPPGAKALVRRLHHRPNKDWAREEARLQMFPASTKGVTNLLGPEIEFADAASFLATAHRLFHRQLYRFVVSTDSPKVIDCGAGIGLSVLYMKALYPRAHVIAFEPDPGLFALLEVNVRRFQLEDVDLRREAAWIATGVAQFRCHPKGEGRLTVREVEPDTLEVKTARLRELLDTRIDFLKITVQGAEADVLADCADVLGAVDRVFVGYRSSLDRPQQLDSILRVLREGGLRVHLETVQPSPQPLLTRQIHDGMDPADMALNIWGYRG
jgi:FkbM family methyltransferase